MRKNINILYGVTRFALNSNDITVYFFIAVYQVFHLSDLLSICTALIKAKHAQSKKRNDKYLLMSISTGTNIPRCAQHFRNATVSRCSYFLSTLLLLMYSLCPYRRSHLFVPISLYLSSSIHLRKKSSLLKIQRLSVHIGQVLTTAEDLKPPKLICIWLQIPI